MDKQAETKVFNDTFVDMVESGRTKEAAISTQKYTRNKLREISFAEKIITPTDITNEELVRGEDPENQVLWIDREPDVAPAISVPLGVVGDGFQFKGTRYPLYFNRLISAVLSKDISKLRNYTYDIRQVLMELSVKELASTVDTRFLNTIDAAIGSINTANALNGLSLPQYVSISGGLTRANLVEAFKVITRLKVPFGPMQPDGANGNTSGCMLVNNVTLMDLLKFERSEVGGDVSQDMFLKGVTPAQVLGVKTISTIKSDLVPDGTIYFFSNEDFLGKYGRLMPLTVYMENKAWILKMFQYMEIGMAIGNVRGAARVDFV